MDHYLHKFNKKQIDKCILVKGDDERVQKVSLSAFKDQDLVSSHEPSPMKALDEEFRKKTEATTLRHSHHRQSSTVGFGPDEANGSAICTEYFIEGEQQKDILINTVNNGQFKNTSMRSSNRSSMQKDGVLTLNFPRSSEISQPDSPMKVKSPTTIHRLCSDRHNLHPHQPDPQHDKKAMLN